MKPHQQEQTAALIHYIFDGLMDDGQINGASDTAAWCWKRWWQTILLLGAGKRMVL